MRGLVVTPGRQSPPSLVDDLPEPDPAEGDVLVEAIAVGVCGTDREIIDGGYGVAPPGRDRLVLGHESLGRVIGDQSGTFRPGELVAGIVRRPDPVPCLNCAVGEWDMCRNGRYTECGIKGRDGFCRERWRIEADFAVRLDPRLEHVGVLLEPTSVVAKAWEHVDRIGSRARWQPRTALVTGAGPIGLLAAMLGAQRGLAVHVLDRVQAGPKVDLVRALGGTYHSGSVEDLRLEPDVVLECTGAAPLVVGVMAKVAPDGVVALTGVSSGSHDIVLDASLLNRSLVLENNAVFGSVNANRRHWQQAAGALARAELAWLDGMISRRVPVGDVASAFQPHDGDVKVVVQF